MRKSCAKMVFYVFINFAWDITKNPTVLISAYFCTISASLKHTKNHRAIGGFIFLKNNFVHTLHSLYKELNKFNLNLLIINPVEN